MQGAVNYSGLSDCSNKLKQIAEDMKDITGEIMNTINAVNSNGYWIGPAAESYIKKSSDLKPIFDEGYIQILGYAGALDDTIKRYQEIDKKISSIMGA